MPNRTAVVTGASRGIGAAIAARLITEGWRVHNLDIIQPVSETGVPWIETDLTEEDSILRAFADILADGPVTGLVNNAGIPNNETLQQTTTDQFDRTVAINMRAPMICAQAVVEGMKSAKFGRIVNMSSRAHLGKAKRTAYAGTKGALVSMTGVWALEMAEHGITVNAVAPGPIRTALFDAANPPDDPRTRDIIDQVPVKRLGEPEDIANAVSFFMNDQSGFVTGQTLYVCGGVTLARGGN
ncbi:MAG: SDR family oxidoreductase [Rhodospirillaceae bacterium]|jgi:3-oxoacyl-[acyl-carrier protein] reductase|nr:SDR family oxidoreductase [Rhodospirillaceae bacterium]MBT5456290.1 SDR family oxidoreductase [Rhodospirillaceae bacterium]